MTINSPLLPPAAEVPAVLALLSAPRAGLVTDIDGTISPFATTPAAAAVNPQARAALQRLLPRLALVAALTGRQAVDGARMLGLPDMLVVGNHGMERLVNGTLLPNPTVLPYVAPVGRMIEALRTAALPPGTILEDKGPTASVHYRLAPDWDAARATLYALMAPLAARENLRLTEGRAIIEIRPPVPIHKGSALRELCAEYRLESVVMLGDDLTDVDAFAAVRALRAEGKIRGLAIGVTGLDGTLPPAVLEQADVHVLGVAGVAQLLIAVADLLT